MMNIVSCQKPYLFRIVYMQHVYVEFEIENLNIQLHVHILRSRYSFSASVMFPQASSIA